MSGLMIGGLQLGSRALLLGATFPPGVPPATLTAGSGLGIRYVGTNDLVPSTVVFVLDVTTIPVGSLFFYHPETSSFAPPWTNLVILIGTSTALPNGLHTVSVTVHDVTGGSDTRTWTFTSVGGSGGGPT